MRHQAQAKKKTVATSDQTTDLLRGQLSLVHDGSRAEAADVKALRVRNRQHRDGVGLFRGRLRDKIKK